MKKRSIVLLSSVTYVFICLVELIVCRLSIIPHWGVYDYTLIEKVLFYVIFILSALLVAFLLKKGNIKRLLINSLIMWCVFIILGQVIGVRYWIGIFTNNEAIVFGVNFLGEDIWISHYIGCFVGMIVDMVILIPGKFKNRINIQK